MTEYKNDNSRKKIEQNIRCLGSQTREKTEKPQTRRDK